MAACMLKCFADTNALCKLKPSGNSVHMLVDVHYLAVLA